MPRRSTIISGGSGNPYASGNGTTNVIPKGNGAGKLSDSALTDNGTNVTSTEAFLAPAGSASLPAYSFSGATNQGFYKASNGVAFANAGNLATPYFLMGVTATEAFRIGTAQNIGWSSAADPNGTANDTFLGRRAAASFRLGAADLNGTPVDQTIGVQNAITGSNLPGGHFTIDAPLGTGTGAAAKVSINRALIGASGTTAQTSTNALAIGQSKTLSNTSATAQTVATITLGSNAGGGCAGTFTLVATDGTNFDSETQSFNVSFVNKAGAVTVGTPAITASTAANNSGSATLGITAVANGNNIDIKVTPVFTTIVPTTVTLYPVISHSTNTVTFI